MGAIGVRMFLPSASPGYHAAMVKLARSRTSVSPDTPQALFLTGDAAGAVGLFPVIPGAALVVRRP